MPAAGSGRRELTSWKEIADYLGVSVRTAQKWEAQRGLPVKRFSGEKGRVLAAPEALDRWRESSLEKPHWWSSPRYLRLWALGASAVVLILAPLYLLPGRKGPPALFRHEQNTLMVSDARGRELWRKTFPDPFKDRITPDDLFQNRQAWFGDLEGDGRIELLYTYVPATVEKHGRTLFCFSDDGREKARLLFPRTCINRKFHPYNWAQPLALSGDRIKLGILEHQPVINASVVYYLDRRLSLIGLEFSDGLRSLHRELEAAGQLDHPLTDQEMNDLRNLRYLKRPTW